MRAWMYGSSGPAVRASAASDAIAAAAKTPTRNALGLFFMDGSLPWRAGPDRLTHALGPPAMSDTTDTAPEEPRPAHLGCTPPGGLVHGAAVGAVSIFDALNFSS